MKTLKLQAIDSNELVNVNLGGASAASSFSIDDPIKLVAIYYILTGE